MILFVIVALLCAAGGAASAVNNNNLNVRVGFGTAAMHGELAVQSVITALNAGFRHIDTAHAKEWYDERSVGIAIKSSGIPREEIFITTKVHPADLGYESAKQSVQSSLEQLQTDYLDSVLLHYAACGDHIPRCVEEGKTGGDFVRAWRALEELHEQGVVRHLGVSNFDIGSLQRLIVTCSVIPHVIQDWADPYHQAHVLRNYARAKKIPEFTSYSTLGTQWQYRIGKNPVLDVEGPIAQIGKKYNASAALVVTSWALQQGMNVIPRSTNAAHIQELAALTRNEMVPLTVQDLNTIAALDGTLY